MNSALYRLGSVSLATALLAGCGGGSVPGGPPADTAATAVAAPALPADSLLVTADLLKPRVAEPGLVLIHVSHRMDSTTTFDLIPGSVDIDYMDIAVHEGPVQTEMLPLDSLRTLFRGLGVSNESRVVIYSPDPIMAARVFVTLEYAGHRRVQVLNGGVDAWKAAGGSVTTIPTKPAPGRFEPALRTDVVVDADWVKARLGDSTIRFLDTRTMEEYTGTGGRRGMPSTGHLAGARLLLWQDLVEREGGPYLESAADLAAAYQAAGAAPDRTHVTYCYVGYRASFSYFVGRLLGYQVRFYDGSYDDWSQRKYPTVAGVSP